MNIAKFVGGVLGTVVAEVQWCIEVGGTPVAGIFVLRSTYNVAKDIAASHTIDSTNSDVVSDNLLDCLEYID